VTSRTELAEDRTILANERTFAGWMRTSLGSIAIGMGFFALFAKLQPFWMPRAIATGFLLLSIAIILLAERRAALVLRRLNPHVVITSRPLNLRLFSGVIIAASLTLIAAIWLGL
jgi:putative membrane protein